MLSIGASTPAILPILTFARTRAERAEIGGGSKNDNLIQSLELRFLE